MRVLLIFVSLMLWTSALLAQAWNIEVLMQSLIDSASPRVGFVETRYSALLDEPLKVVGELEYKPPNTLIRRTLTPRQETFTIEDSHLTISRGRQEDRYLPLSAAPILKGLAIALRSVLSGDLTTLQAHFSLEISGNESCWSLQLKPLDSKVANEISILTIYGEYTQLRSFIINEPDGDRSEVVLDIIKDASH